MNPTSWNWQGKTAFFWAGANLLGLVWVSAFNSLCIPLRLQATSTNAILKTYFRLPEPKGLTYADLDVLFENKISARQFRKVEVDPYRSDNLVVVADETSSDGEKVSQAVHVKE